MKVKEFIAELLDKDCGEYKLEILGDGNVVACDAEDCPIEVYPISNTVLIKLPF